MDTPIHVVEFHTQTGQPLTEHGVTPSVLDALQEMFEDVRVVSTNTCGCEFCASERERHGVHHFDPEPEPEPSTCGLCGRRVALAPGRSICASCAHWPLD